MSHPGDRNAGLKCASLIAYSSLADFDVKNPDVVKIGTIQDKVYSPKTRFRQEG